VFLADSNEFLLTTVAYCNFLWVSIDSSGSAGFQFAPALYVLRQTNVLFFIVRVPEIPSNPLQSFIIPLNALLSILLSYSIYYV